METKIKNRINFMKPPFKGVFKTVQTELKNKYKRDITIEAVSQAYDRCDPIVVNLVKEEIERRLPEHEQKVMKIKKAKEKKEKFEMLLSKKLQTVEV